MSHSNDDTVEAMVKKIKELHSLGYLAEAEFEIQASMALLGHPPVELIPESLIEVIMTHDHMVKALERAALPKTETTAEAWDEEPW